MKKYIFTFILCLFSVSAYSQEMRIAPKALPAVIRQSFRAAYPNAKINSASKETVKGETMYEVMCKDSLASRTISLTSDGKIVETEENISIDRLPDPVSNAITKQYPKGRIMKIELSVKGTQTQYEVLIKSKGKKMEVAFYPDGTMAQGQ